MAIIKEKPINKNDVIEAEIDGFGYDGEGIAHIGGYTVFIKYAIIGERVRAKVILCKATFAVAKLIEVLKSSPYRAEPFCNMYYKCGGCSMQHIKYSHQLLFKKQAIAETFYKTSKLTVEPSAVIPSDKTECFRNKMSLPVRGNEPDIGFFAEGTHRVINIENCPAQFEKNGFFISALKDYMVKNNLSGYNETDNGGHIRHLAVRKIQDFYTVTLVLNGRFKNKVEGFNDILSKELKDNYAFYVNYNFKAGNKILGEQSELVGGTEKLTDIDGIKVFVHPQSFFQVNDGIRKILYGEIAREAEGEKIINAYCGAGLETAIISKKAKSVTGIEIEQKAVESAKLLIKNNGIQNVKFVCADCADYFNSSFNGCDTLILDPPRSGCDIKVINSIIKMRPKKIIYVSCNPATLSRDSALLLNGGYVLKRLSPLDMFPHSGNVEVLSVFTYGK